MRARVPSASWLLAALVLASCKTSASPAITDSATASAAPVFFDASPDDASTTEADASLSRDLDDAASPAPSARLDTRLRARANEVLAALKARDMTALGALADPVHGVRFTPYPYVDTKSDVTLSPEVLRSAMTDKRVRNWGAHDGSGDPIKLTFSAYFKRFVWTHDFLTAPNVSVDQAMGTGNTVDNFAEAYRGAHYVELYFGGFDPKMSGMDWESLRLVFVDAQSPTGATLWLVGIIHGEWTI